MLIFRIRDDGAEFRFGDDLAADLSFMRETTTSSCAD